MEIVLVDIMEEWLKDVRFGNDGDCPNCMYLLLIQGFRYMLNAMCGEKFEVALFSNMILITRWADFTTGLPARGRLLHFIL